MAIDKRYPGLKTARRFFSGLVVREVARTAHVSTNTVISWKNGKGLPRIKDLDALEGKYGPMLELREAVKGYAYWKARVVPRPPDFPVFLERFLNRTWNSAVRLRDQIAIPEDGDADQLPRDARRVFGLLSEIIEKCEWGIDLVAEVDLESLPDGAKFLP